MFHHHVWQRSHVEGEALKPMKPTRPTAGGGLLRLLAILSVFALVAAACGGSDDSADEGGSTDESVEASEEEAEDAGSVDEDAADAAAAEAAEEEAGSEEGSAATSIEELEAEWAANRQAIVDELAAGIEAGDYGVGDDNILRGPAGFETDLNNCPADWSDTEGIGDTIKIGHPGVQSGNLAAYGNMGLGWEVYLDYVNETHGGVGDIPIELLRRDDGYEATRTIELVDELLQTDKPLVMHTLGSPNSLAVYDTLNDNCIPHLFTATGHPAWGDPVNHPWTTSNQLSYYTEATLWGTWIKQNMADQLPVTVAGLVMDNDFGLAYENAMEDYAEANPDVVAEFSPIRHDPAAPTVTNEMTTIAASDPDVFISMTAGNPCLLAVQEAGNNGLNDGETVLFAPSVCKSPSEYMIPAGDASDNWLIVGGGQKVNTDPQYADDVYVQWANEMIEGAGYDSNVGLYFTGFGFFAWQMVEALRIANDLPGGLTRSNLMLTARSLDLEHPALIDGISFSVSGNEDSYFIEGSDYSRFDFANETWVQEGGIIDLNGSSPNCAFVDGTCTEG